MCLRPTFIDGLEVSCRTCDACLQSRLSDWVYRCCAEAAHMGHSFGLCLTYANNADGSKPVGAIGFKYSDVQAFLKRVRQTIKRRTGKNHTVRYIVAGEVGSKGTQRVHYHMVLFCSVPIADFFEWVRADNGAAVASHALQENVRYHFKAPSADEFAWPHGHVVIQKPGYKGFFYVLKYALKGLDGLKAARGTNRITEIDNWPASHFMMSKKPAIGLGYFLDLRKRWADTGWCPPSLTFRIPGSNGFYYPVGLMRERIIQIVRHGLIDYYDSTGSVPPSLSSLVHSLSDPDAPASEVNTDLERLCYGEEEEERATKYEGRVLQLDATSGVYKIPPRGTPDLGTIGPGFCFCFGKKADALAAEIAKRQREASARYRTAQVVKTCGGFIPCEACRHSLEIHERSKEFAEAYRANFEQYQKTRWHRNPSAKGPQDYTQDQFDAEYRREAEFPGPFCYLRETKGVAEAFGRLRAVRGLQRGTVGRQGPDAERGSGQTDTRPHRPRPIR